MLTIRFARVGKKNRPHFKIMLQEHTIAPGGTHVEVLGSYDPHRKVAVLKEERIKYWVSQGVKISDTAYNLFLKQGVITGEKRKVKIPARKAEPSEARPQDSSSESGAADGPAKKVEEAPTEVVAEVKPEDKKDEAAEAPKVETGAPATETKKEKKPKEKNEEEIKEVKPEEQNAQ